MLTLILLRHAKSSWDNTELDDVARPLAPRGMAAAPRMGAYLLQTGTRPDVILCSASVRTRATLDLVLPQLGDPVPAIAFEDGLYLASAEDLLARLKKVPARCPRVMMIGHNPGFHNLAVMLAGSGDPQLRDAVAAKFPTSGLAILTFDAVSWPQIVRRGGNLAQFMTPARLPHVNPQKP
jgi:phosphohistidine phosphatase